MFNDIEKNLFTEAESVKRAILCRKPEPRSPLLTIQTVLTL